MKIRRIDKTRNGSKHRITEPKEAIQAMKGARETKSSLYMIAAAVIGLTVASLLFSRAVGAAVITSTVGGGNGSISPAGAVAVNNGLDQTFIFTPADKYTIGTITVDGVPVPQRAPAYTFKSVAANHSISVTFAVDSDNDGLSDDQESQGIALDIPAAYSNYLPCTNASSDRTTCVDKATRDLFVVLVPAAGGYFKNLQNPLQYITQSTGGLPITVHTIILPEGATDASERFVSPSSAQKYVRVKEILSTSYPNLLGESEGVGTPNGFDNTKVYTQNIRNTVFNITGKYDLADTYIKQTIAHEVGHAIGPLRKDYMANCGGNHYCTSTKAPYYIMNQSVFSKGTTLYIGTTFTSAGTNNDQASVKLK
jgi:hypothetical protein